MLCRVVCVCVCAWLYKRVLLIWSSSSYSHSSLYYYIVYCRRMDYSTINWFIVSLYLLFCCVSHHFPQLRTITHKHTLAAYRYKMLPFETPTIFEQLPRFIFQMPRVVADQKSKFENDELFRKLSRESEVCFSFTHFEKFEFAFLYLLLKFFSVSSYNRFVILHIEIGR